MCKPLGWMSQSGLVAKQPQHAIRATSPGTSSLKHPAKPVKSTELAALAHLQAADNPLHLIPGQLEDFPECMDSSRDPSPVDSTTSLWIDLGPNCARLGHSSDEDSAGSRSVQDKIRYLEKTEALLQAQLEAPKSTTPKLFIFKVLVELVKETLSPEDRISMNSPQKKGRGLRQAA